MYYGLSQSFNYYSFDKDAMGCDLFDNNRSRNTKHWNLKRSKRLLSNSILSPVPMMNVMLKRVGGRVTSEGGKGS